jgi:SRSO17 transposase
MHFFIFTQVEVYPLWSGALMNSLQCPGITNKLRSVALECVSGTKSETLWDDLVTSHHYLGYKKLLGHRLKYLAFVQDRPVAALSWSAPALTLKFRDQFIGWSDTIRKQYLGHVAANSRFVIFPWVNIPNLGSYILGQNLKRIRKDWMQAFHQDLWLVESFVDPRYFRGTVYKASNWTFLGTTKGYTKTGSTYTYHGRTKDIYVYVLEPRLWDILGCTSTLPGPYSKQVEEVTMSLQSKQWNPDIFVDLDPDDITKLADVLTEFHHQFSPCFQRCEQEKHGLGYISGLLSNIKSKSIEPIALELGKITSVRTTQLFMKNSPWKHEVMLDTHQKMIVPHLSSPQGMITIDPSEFPKKGTKSVGVARQYCGHLGKTESCQSGVFIGYTSEKGHCLLDCQLYMPECWFDADYQNLRRQNLVPEDLCFQTKQEIALGLLKNVTKYFSGRWIGMDAAFGADMDFLQALPADMYYFADIKANEKVFLEKPEVGVPEYQGRGRPPSKERVLSDHRLYEVRELAKSKDLPWRRVSLGEGAKGPLLAQMACIRVYPSRDGLPCDQPVWLVIRIQEDGKVKYAFSNAPETMPFEELHQASCMRYPIEQCFEEGKSYLGMDDYEHRSWPAWHRHMIYVMLAQHFLILVQERFKKNSRADNSSGQKACPNRIYHEVIDP